MGKKSLTMRQARYAEGVASGMRPTAAARAAGYSQPAKAVWELQGNAEIRRYVGECLAGRGISMDTLAQAMEEGLKATVTETHLNKGGKDRPAQILYSEPMADYQTRHKYLDTALDLLGAKGVRDGKDEGGQAQTNIYVLAAQFNHLTDEQLSEAMSEAMTGQINLAKYGVSLPGELPLPEVTE